VTFDCYGTLVDWQGGFTAFLATFMGDRAHDVVRAYHRFERVVEREAPHKAYKDVVATALVRAAGECGVPLAARDAEALTRRWGAMRLFADVEGLLAELRRRGFRLAVLTNCDDDLFEATHRSFAAPFDLFVTAERVRGYKPAPWHFRAFELLTRATRDRWVHVACSWYHDVAPARAFGVPCVWLDRERTGEDPDAAVVRVDDAGQVVDAVDQVFGAVAT
jgi:2-haloacid dehalogenase